jgi:hypothetical protein
MASHTHTGPTRLCSAPTHTGEDPSLCVLTSTNAHCLACRAPTHTCCWQLPLPPLPPDLVTSQCPSCASLGSTSVTGWQPRPTTSYSPPHQRLSHLSDLAEVLLELAGKTTAIHSELKSVALLDPRCCSTLPSAGPRRRTYGTTWYQAGPCVPPQPCWRWQQRPPGWRWIPISFLGLPWRQQCFSRWRSPRR